MKLFVFEETDMIFNFWVALNLELRWRRQQGGDSWPGFGFLIGVLLRNNVDKLLGRD